MNEKERFLNIYQSTILRDGSDKLLKWLEDSDFFVAPASIKFHGSFEGGLLVHSLNVYDCLLEEIKVAGLEKVWSDETLALVALMHDLCKVNFYKKEWKNVKEDGKWTQKEVYVIDERFPCGHGEKSVIILQNYMRLSADEIWAIRAHMGFSDTSFKGGDRFIGQIFEKCPLALLLHVADMKATYLLGERRGNAGRSPATS